MKILRKILSFTFELINESDWVGKFIGLSMLLACGLMLFGILPVVIWTADNTLRPIQCGKGEVVDKEFIPAHETTQMIHVGKTTIPSRTHHPDKWTVEVSIANQVDSVSVTKEFHDKVAKGDPIAASYVIGRFTGKMYLKEVRK